MGRQGVVGNDSLLKTLLDASTNLGSTLELDTLLDLVMDSACRIFHTAAASLLLIDEESDTLYFKTATGDKREELKQIRLKMGEGVAGWVARERKPLVVNDTHHDSRHAEDIATLIDFPAHRIMCVPLLVGDRALGVMEVLNKFSGSFTDDDLEAFCLLAAQVSNAIENARRFESASTENDRYKELFAEKYRVIGESDLFRAAMDTLAKAARTSSTVLLRGESGTGKEVAARWVHKHSPRSRRPLVSVNCAAIADSLLESELFGYEKGSFTGADRQKKGKFEQADGGTIFLDEIGSMSFLIQGKILRVLQEREVDRVGGERPVPVDVRVIAATNTDLERAMKEGRFREDLFYRLNVISVTLPPLRSRREDIPPLVDHFIARYNRETNKNVRGISARALEILMNYDFPGNVRELANVIERGVVLEDGELIQSELIMVRAASPCVPCSDDGDSLEHGAFPTLDEMECRHVLRALRRGGTKTAACKLLGVSRPTLDRKIQKYGLVVSPRSRDG